MQFKTLKMKKKKIINFKFFWTDVENIFDMIFGIVILKKKRQKGIFHDWLNDNLHGIAKKKATLIKSIKTQYSCNVGQL